jgi:hypothetical protein
MMSCEYLREFSKKFETALMVYSEAVGKLVQEKKPEAKNLVTLSLFKGMVRPEGGIPTLM